jgi:hypothetical protein|tara:strand:- start:1672 stop:2604 length:933 start_codon:yes stop_codon:yes gene_type:complete
VKSVVFVKFLIKLLVCTLPLAAYGQITPALPGYQDHPVLNKFPDSVIVEHEFSEDVNYRFVLSSLQRTAGQVVPENSERLRGGVTKITYEVSGEFNGADVYQFFREQIAERGYEEAFSCEGRACGSSNYWANDIFRNRILYGPERNQYYIAMTAETGAESKSHVALYIITRGNRRLYAYLEIVDVGEPLELPVVSDPSAILDSFRQDQTLVLTSVSFANDELLVGQSDLTLAVQLLQMAPELSVYVVAHLREEVPLATLLQRSLARAESVVERLIQLGIRVDRLNPQGLGPLVPQCVQDSCADRIELVIQ